MRISKLFGAAVIMAAALVVGTGTAHAAYPAAPGWSSPAHMAPLAPICFETGGGRVLGPAITAAAAGWDKSDLSVVAKARCYGYSRQATVKFVARYDSAVNARGYVTWCARYAPVGNKYTWTYLRGVWTWVADAPQVEVNYTPLAVKQCLGSLALKTNIMSHETGHYFGLSHAVGITVMTSATQTTYVVGTRYDLARLDGRY
jgi:hypothetical protein